ncbi:DUF619-domain-containing protein [Hesseltinella vesiculosa]|uniref:Amino-acid acetyltransferase, mitochondrial n=1 Tax=Hesseltinella vesiculosa TaxID=101127 RepID=A0A1X2GN71_9FUNG|nr:DUF619-domain-containing protein [Hesseltinella vesiculosa]
MNLVNKIRPLPAAFRYSKTFGSMQCLRFKHIPASPLSTAHPTIIDSLEKPNVRDLLENVMHTSPSKRELQQFLKRYEPLSIPNRSTASSVPSPKDFVSDLLTPAYTNQLSLTKIEAPFHKKEWIAVGATLHKLQKLGLTSVVVVDNPSWHELGRENCTATMMRESMALVEAIQKAGGRAQLIYGGLLESTQPGTKHGHLHVNLDFVYAALNNHQIPVILPLHDKRPIASQLVMTSLAAKLSRLPDTRLVPNKIVIINHKGGIPNHEYNGSISHSLINVQEEYDSIMQSWQPEWQYPNADLTMVRDCLALLSPISASAVITPVSSLPNALIANLVTDKPLYSSSLPHHQQLHRINTSRTTILRHGIKIQKYQSLDQLNLPRLTALLEASFQRSLDSRGFYDRLHRVLDSAIIAGDYQGVVLMTQEAPSIFYLDKFAIAPTSQGIGLTDILWRRMCDSYPELLWRSRKDNGVNKWYFERSHGYWRLPDSNWVLFWYGSQGYRHVQQYANIATHIPASFT